MIHCVLMMVLQEPTVSQLYRRSHWATPSVTLLSKAGFLFRKWNSSKPAVFQCIHLELWDFQSVHTIMDPETEYTKSMGSEWNVSLDHFRLSVLNLPSWKCGDEGSCIWHCKMSWAGSLHYSEAQDSSAMTVEREGPMGLPSANTHTSSLVSMGKRRSR